MKANKIKYLVFPLILVVAWVWMACYTFNDKPDLNGDNFCYYIYASSMAEGHGYCDLSSPGAPATSNFPPGYPILMTPLRWITDSIVAQKCLNELFVLISILLIYFALLRLNFSESISLTAALSCAFLPRLWHFSTMMMSEASFLLTSVIILYAMIRMTEKEDQWYSELKSPWLYLMIIMLVLNYHIRMQGLALVVAVILGFAIRKRWGALLGTITGFVLGYLPWKLRNSALGLNNNRYMDSIMLANPWQPEAGTLGMDEIVTRFFSTVKMLLFNAIPNTIAPFVEVDCDHPEYSLALYLLGIILVGIMLVGCWKMEKVRWLLILYFGATIGIISIFSSPSGNRYLTSVLPLLSMTLFVGLWVILTWLVQRKWKEKTFPAYVLILLLLTAKTGLKAEHEMSQQKFPIQYKQFFQLGKDLKKIAPKDAVVCSRKPQMLWMYSDRPGVVYRYTSNAEELIMDLVDKKVDYVVLDALGYSSTGLYLYPALQKYFQFFTVVKHYEASHNYLLQFNRQDAELFFANVTHETTTN